MAKIEIKNLEEFFEYEGLQGELFFEHLKGLARRFSEDHNGGQWFIKTFEYRKKNLIYFDINPGKEEYNVSSDLNMYEGKMSKDAFLLGIFNIALSQFSFHIEETGNEEALEFYINLHDNIRDAAPKILTKKEDLSAFYGLTD